MKRIPVTDSSEELMVLPPRSSRAAGAAFDTRERRADRFADLSAYSLKERFFIRLADRAKAFDATSS